jgi:5-methylcytosine-specific restriction endonuclease McrA
MSLEECARRMTALLNRKPRSRKTRAYLETLPKRRKPVIVSPEDYPQAQPAVIRFTPEPVKARPVKPDAAPVVRKDRMRPRAIKRAAEQPTIREPGWEIWRNIASPRPKPPPAPQGKAAGRWHCRPSGRHLRPWASGAGKLDRSLELTMRQRLFLYAAQDGLCALCGEAMEGAAFGFSLDHVIPRSLEGFDGFGNLVLCHGECNGRKTNDVPTGCEMVWLLAVNSRLGFKPVEF